MTAVWWRRAKFVAYAFLGMMLSGTATADRHGGGGGGGHGGGGGGGSSFSSRSFGGDSGSSSRSFSDGGSRSMRSFSSGDSGSSRSFRSFSSGDSGSSLRSFNSGSSSRSFSDGPSVRNDFRPSVRSSDSGTSSSGGSSVRSFSDGSPSLRSLNSGSASDSGTRVFSDSSRGNSSNDSRVLSSQSNGNSGGSQNSFQGRSGRSQVDQAQLQTFLNQQSNGQNSQSSSNKMDGRTTIYGQQFGSNNGANGGGARTYQTRRMADDDAQNSSNGQESNASRVTNNNAANGERSVLKGDGQNFNRNRDNASDGGNLNANAGDRVTKDGKQFKFNNGSNNELNKSGNKGPGWATAQNSERSNKLDKHLNLDKSKGPNLGDGRNTGFDKGIVRDGGDREFRGSDRARGDFKNWSKIWSGKGGEGHDHRDWSGKWRDGDRFNIAHDIRGDWHNRHDFDRFPFRGGWWGHDHHHGWGFWNDYCVRWNRPWFWWSWTSAPLLYDWCGFGWSTPYYWDYGPGEYIYCNDGVVYVNGVWYQPAPVFYQQTVQMVEAAPVLAQEAAAQVDWLPLGVFAATPDGLKEPSVMVQLAVTKEGVIGGTAFDQKAGKSYNIQGTVDKNTQRAVWSYNDDKNNRIVMETSVNNLTQNESTGLVHYGPNDMRVVEFVRLQEPDAKPAAQPAGPLVPPQGK